MTSKALDKLAEIGQLKREAPDQNQINGLIDLAKERLADLDAQGISQAGKFSAAYSAAHSLALAALHWHGFRSDNRYLVFQCLQYTPGLESSKWRVLDTAHKLRNRIIEITRSLLPEVEKLDSV
jgi:hypothetical protein